MNQESFHFYSSGGLGDALIISLKINQTRKVYAIHNEYPAIYWDHAEKHECHKYGISKIMEETVGKDYYLCHIESNNPEEYIKEKCYARNETYLDTKISNIKYPYLMRKFGEDFILPWKQSKTPHIVINMFAGRMHDNTKRQVDVNIVHKIAKEFSNRRIVLLGPEIITRFDDEFSQYEGRIYNATGRTETIIDAFSFINDCCLFIGQDGVLAYYALMLKKPTIIHFHISNLIDHYFNKEWAKHSLALVGEDNNFKSLDLNNTKVRELLEMAEYNV